MENFTLSTPQNGQHAHFWQLAFPDSTMLFSLSAPSRAALIAWVLAIVKVSTNSHFNCDFLDQISAPAALLVADSQERQSHGLVEQYRGTISIESESSSSAALDAQSGVSAELPSPPIATAPRSPKAALDANSSSDPTVNHFPELCVPPLVSTENACLGILSIPSCTDNGIQSVNHATTVDAASILAEDALPILVSVSAAEEAPTTLILAEDTINRSDSVLLSPPLVDLDAPPPSICVAVTDEDPSQAIAFSPPRHGFGSSSLRRLSSSIVKPAAELANGECVVNGAALPFDSGDSELLRHSGASQPAHSTLLQELDSIESATCALPLTGDDENDGGNIATVDAGSAAVNSVESTLSMMVHGATVRLVDRFASRNEQQVLPITLPDIASGSQIAAADAIAAVQRLHSRQRLSHSAAVTGSTDDAVVRSVSSRNSYSAHDADVIISKHTTLDSSSPSLLSDRSEALQHNSCSDEVGRLLFRVQQALQPSPGSTAAISQRIPTSPLSRATSPITGHSGTTATTPPLSPRFSTGGCSTPTSKTRQLQRSASQPLKRWRTTPHSSSSPHSPHRAPFKPLGEADQQQPTSAMQTMPRSEYPLPVEEEIADVLLRVGQSLLHARQLPTSTEIYSTDTGQSSSFVNTGQSGRRPLCEAASAASSGFSKTGITVEFEDW